MYRRTSFCDVRIPCGPPSRISRCLGWCPRVVPATQESKANAGEEGSAGAKITCSTCANSPLRDPKCPSEAGRDGGIFRAQMSSKRHRTPANFLWSRFQSPLRLKIHSQASHLIVPRALGVVMHIPRGVATCGDLASALRLPVPLPGPLPALFPPCPPRCLVTSLACDGSYFAASSCGTPSLSFFLLPL